MNECWTLLHRLFILFNSIRYTYSYWRPRRPMINKTRTSKEGAGGAKGAGVAAAANVNNICIPKGRTGKNIRKKRKDDDDVRRRLRGRWSNSENYRHLLLSLHLIHFHKFSKNQSPASIYKFSKISKRGMKISQNFLRKIVVWGWLKSLPRKKGKCQNLLNVRETKND